MANFVSVMMTTDKISCRITAEILAAHGIEDVVLSPGSRNAPLILALSRQPGLRCHVVIDERSAAFFGLGIAIETGKAVALVCTSGSAVLNYGPALSEAYYRHIPLIAISADRPYEWIDQDDSQTIRQNGVLNNIVKASYEIDVENGSKVQTKFISRTINDAIIKAVKAPQGPVHINIRLDEPLGNTGDFNMSGTKIERTDLYRPTLTHDAVKSLADKLIGKRVMVIAGFASPDKSLSKSLAEFAVKTDVAVLHEAQSNIHLEKSVPNIDATLTTLTENDRDEMMPDIVITCGGSIVSRMIKRYLRSNDKLEHWHIGFNENSIDCFTSLTQRIECEAIDFLNNINLCCSCSGHSYQDKWFEKSKAAKERTKDYYKNCSWSDFYAVGRLMALIPRDWQLQLSNGTSVRYAQLFDYSQLRRIEANRGVSGIDGSTSTAIGAHIYYKGVTMLLTGDMSAQYDSGAFALNEISPRFKMAVLNNSGGGIFRFIKSTSNLEECEHCFAGNVNLPLSKLAEAYNFAYFEVSDIETFDRVFAEFAAESNRPAILNIITPSIESAQILKQYFS